MTQLYTREVPRLTRYGTLRPECYPDLETRINKRIGGDVQVAR